MEGFGFHGVGDTDTHGSMKDQAGAVLQILNGGG